MNIMEVFTFAAENLNYFMFGVLGSALALRYVVYRSGTHNHVYFKTFTRTVEKMLENDERGEKISNAETWLTQLLHRVTEKLPERSVRFGQNLTKANDEGSTGEAPHKESMEEFTQGKKFMLNSIKQQMDAFKSAYPPNFSELTTRILSRDRQWNTVMRVVPIETLARVLDILPGLFVVGGIFGTFLGITAALPVIAKIDLSNLDTATPILNEFVGSIAFAMNTSIVGIVCSVIMTVLNTIFPLKSVRQDVKKSLERCMQFIWYRIHGEKISTGDKNIIETLQQILTALSKDQSKERSKAS